MKKALKPVHFIVNSSTVGSEPLHCEALGFVSGLKSKCFMNISHAIQCCTHRKLIAFVNEQDISFSLEYPGWQCLYMGMTFNFFVP